MRIRRLAFLSTIATCAIAVACIPELITDPLEPTQIVPQLGHYCGDGILTIGQYDAGLFYATGEQCDPSTGNDGGANDAGVIGCSAGCLVECDGGRVDPATNHCYFQVPATTSLDDGVTGAESRCQSLNAHVVTFADENERTFVLQNFGREFGAGDAATFWVGISEDPNQAAYVPVDLETNEPGWSPTCSGCYAPSNVDGSIPKILTDAGGNCILDIGRLGWSEFACTQIKTPVPVICEREPVGDLWIQCTGGLCASIPETAGKKRYLYVPTNVPGDQAELDCENLIGGTLVVFDSREERETLLRALINHFPVSATGDPPPSSVWIGYSIGAEEGGVFGWENEAGLDASPWGDNEPSAEASAPVRAYASLDTVLYDVQLAHDETPQTGSPYICQY